MPEQQQTNTAPNLSDEQALAKLEERVAAMELGPFRREWEGIIAIEKNRQRIRAIERATKVTLPPDNRGWTGKPAPSSAPAPPAEPSQQRPTGWQKFDAIGPPPGVDICDRMMDAQDFRDRMEREREYKQAVLDAFAEDKLVAEQRRRAQAERTCHVGPGDPDWDIK
jgi:hypothetical protein